MEQSFACAQEDIGGVKILKKTLFKHFNQDKVGLLLALEATELVSESVAQITVELIKNHLISVEQKRLL